MVDRTPGVVVKGLLTRHIITTRLRDGDDWTWMTDAATGIPHDADWRSTLTALGYRLERRHRRGWLARAGQTPALVVHPTAGPADFTRLDRDGRPPAGVLAVDCAADNVPYGVLASGSRLRLFRFTAEPGAPAATTSFLELDSAALRRQDRPLLGLLAPDALRRDGHFGRLVMEARRSGSALHDRLDAVLRLRVLPELARGLGAWARCVGRNLADPANREELECACLIWVFRALFVLYAESAGYVPLDQAEYAANAATTLATQAIEAGDTLDARSTSLWNRFQVLVQALRTGDIAMGVPAYPGDLFSARALPGACLLERARLSNASFGRVLAALGHDPATGTGVDYSSLEVGHLGRLYEGLLSLRLSLAGELFWQANPGGRKAGGVYYTPDLLVEHLVCRAVLPALEDHLHEVRRLATDDPAEAARKLFGFRVLDPACGSAHFLVTALHRMVERMECFLADHPLPAVHADLLHRLVLKRCIYGVDVSPMGAEVARLSLWLASFVPGLPLPYLGHNVQVGDSLVGVADPGVLAGDADPGRCDERVGAAIAEGATVAAELLAIDDRTPDGYADSLAVDQRLKTATAPVGRLFDAWTAGALDVPVIERIQPLHWPLAFPEVFADPRPGFHAVVGNPPWEEVTVEELAFYARHWPGLRGLPAVPREQALTAVKKARPELAEQFAAEQQRTALLRAFLSPHGGYAGSVGDPDLYKFFCQRYRTLLASQGCLGVVLPRSTFLTAGSRDFRRWLFGSSRVDRLDFLVNNRLWIFPTHPQYTVALVVASAAAPDDAHRVEVAGVAACAEAFRRQASGAGIRLHRDALGPDGEMPLLPCQDAEPVLRTMRRHGRFAYGGGRWRCFPVAEFHETNDKRLWQGETQGWSLWKGESFDQHDPHGAQARWCPPSAAALAKATKPRPGSESILAREVSLDRRRAAAHAEVGNVRLAFRDVSRAADSRTVRASLVPAETFLTNKAPYLSFVDGEHRERAACTAVMNSLPFDWQARRFVETNLNFFILELLTVPDFDDASFAELVRLGGRLSCPDSRFTEVAQACGVEIGPLEPAERMVMRARVDALVARAYGLDPAALDVLLADFTLDAVPRAHRDLLRCELEDLCRRVRQER